MGNRSPQQCHFPRAARAVRLPVPSALGERRGSPSRALNPPASTAKLPRPIPADGFIICRHTTASSPRSIPPRLSPRIPRSVDCTQWQCCVSLDSFLRPVLSDPSPRPSACGSAAPSIFCFAWAWPGPSPSAVDFARRGADRSFVPRTQPQQQQINPSDPSSLERSKRPAPPRTPQPAQPAQSPSLTSPV